MGLQYGIEPTGYHGDTASKPAYVIAAVDSPHPLLADVQCDGVADDVQVNTAISSISPGQKILMLEGNYNFSDEVLINKAFELECRGIITLSGASGKAGFVLGSHATRVTGFKGYVYKMEGTAKANGHDAVRIVNAFENRFEFEHILNMRYVFYFLQEGVGDLGQENIFKYTLVSGCTKGVYFPSTCIAEHEGNQFHGGAIFNTEVCYDDEVGTYAGGVYITGVLDAAYNGGNPAWLDYRRATVDGTQLGNLLLLKFIYHDNLKNTFFYKDVITGLFNNSEFTDARMRTPALEVGKLRYMDANIIPSYPYTYKSYFIVSGSNRRMYASNGSRWPAGGCLYLEDILGGGNPGGVTAQLAQKVVTPNHPVFAVILLKDDGSSVNPVAKIDEIGMIYTRRVGTFTVTSGTKTVNVADANAHADDRFLFEMDAGSEELGGSSVTKVAWTRYTIAFQNNATADRHGKYVVIRGI